MRNKLKDTEIVLTIIVFQVKSFKIKINLCEKQLDKIRNLKTNWKKISEFIIKTVNEFIYIFIFLFPLDRCFKHLSFSENMSSFCISSECSWFKEDICSGKQIKNTEEEIHFFIFFLHCMQHLLPRFNEFKAFCTYVRHFNVLICENSLLKTSRNTEDTIVVSSGKVWQHKFNKQSFKWQCWEI